MAFGAPGFDGATVARACIASMAIPPMFSPVRLGDRHYISSGSAEVERRRHPVDVMWCFAKGAGVLVSSCAQVVFVRSDRLGRRLALA